MDYILLLNDALKIIVGASIFFVWVVRYQNIVEEFKEFQLPEWLRDMVGIFKIAFAFHFSLQMIVHALLNHFLETDFHDCPIVFGIAF